MIEVKNLTKVYGNHSAIKDLSLVMESGGIYGLLGPNGAGKTTIMNIITGCIAATSGTASIGGYDILQQPKQAKKLIGYLPEHPPLYQDMTPDEYLFFVAQAKGISKKDIPEQIEKALRITHIESMRGRLIHNLSKGYQQRAGIAQALLGNPQVIILDEPTVGLDPKQTIEIRNMIRDLGKNHTVILSSHILSDVRAVCDYILIISHGELVASDTPESLEKHFWGSATINLVIRASEKEAEEALSKLDNVKDWHFSEAEDGMLRVEVISEKQEDLREAIFFAFSDFHLPILEMTTAKASLEDIFIELTDGDKYAEKPGYKEDRKDDSSI